MNTSLQFRLVRIPQGKIVKLLTEKQFNNFILRKFVRMISNCKRLKKVFVYQIFILILFILADCAKIGYPEGGPKDEDPPRVLSSKPENYSVEFDRDRIEITFDEFIQLKNINQELVISPPLEGRPLIRMRGKTLLIDLNNELHENTTYTLNFGQGIADNNEGNLLENYEFVLSTGNYLDSLSVAGRLLNAYDLKPSEEPVMVMLHENIYDSVLYLEIPTYIGKTRENGTFAVNNVKADTFLIVALKDANNNFIYDIPDEPIAFFDTLLILSPDLFDSLPKGTYTEVDSLQDEVLPDTIEVLTDSLSQADSLQSILHPYSFVVDLFLFQEDNVPQYLSDFKRLDRRMIRFIFNRPLRGELDLAPLNFTTEGDWCVKENHLLNDTIDYWITDSLIYKLDTLNLKLSYLTTDSVMNYVPFTDTVNLIYIKSATRRRRRIEEGEVQEMLQLKLNVKSGMVHDIFKDLVIETAHPVQKMDTDKISLFYSIDTVEHQQSFSFHRDTFYCRKFRMKANWKEDTPYRLFLEPGVFQDVYGLTHDTIEILFKTQQFDHYGKIILNLSGINGSTIIQLMDDKEKIIREQYIFENGSLHFDFLEPAKYMLKCIIDKNHNQKWDTGRYLEKRQPEKVIYYSGAINVRSNWDMDISWDLRND